ncbi:hypothetical protein ASA_P4G052 (plasmid) [Aeromonas salmonicida subsp. salmonicida A449]|uniref:Uncharacterized protein n=2 Tax=Aeromonas salmonicida subsp. salmonicida TaxID=29491 RepID=A0A189PGH1_AERSS|nr:hypothetical protein ASA_P4G052 [Aeromonas salmonicida subsp. salmonicida A449]ALL42298.1 hypothetical protein [Aeromonas salmonicida subsp. salmonicida]
MVFRGLRSRIQPTKRHPCLWNCPKWAFRLLFSDFFPNPILLSIRTNPASTELPNSQGISWLQRALIVRQKMKKLHHPSIYLEKHTKKSKAII